MFFYSVLTNFFLILTYCNNNAKIKTVKILFILTIFGGFMDKGFNNPNVVFNFQDNFDKGIQLLTVGYNDFNYIESIKYPRMISSRYTIHYVFSGSGKIFIDDKVYPIKAKQFFFLPTGCKICYYPNEDDKWTYFWITFTGHHAEDFISTLQISKKCPVVSAPDDLSESEFYDFAQDISSKRQISYYKAKSMLYLVADALCTSKQVGGFTNFIVKEAKEMLKLNYDSRELSLENVASALHISHSYLSKIFKVKTGKTLVEYLIDVRLSAAADLLKNTNLSARQISFNVGYSDEIHFLKQFKKRYGVTTKEYREKNRE